jgi:hypothetical protein
VRSGCRRFVLIGKQRPVTRNQFIMPISIVCCAQAARCSGADVSQSAPGRSAGAPNTSRRRLGSQLSAAAALSLLWLRPLPAAALTPYQRGLALEYGLSADGRIRSCPSDANPNCISTSGNNTVRLPWTAALRGVPGLMGICFASRHLQCH